MNFVISSSTLLKHLQRISGVLTTSNALPILDNFLFHIEEGQLTVSASDLETVMQTTLTIESKENGKICVPAKIILDVLKNLPEQPLNFQVEPASFEIEIIYSNGKSKMSGFNGEDFPRLPEVQNSNNLKITGEVLSEAINKTLFATGNDDLRPVMSGVFCEFSPEQLTFVGTDAHKLVRYRRMDSLASNSSSFILPKKALNLLKTNLKGEEEVMITYNDSNAVFDFNDMILVCRLIDGKYPNYEAVIPSENPNVLNVDRQSFLSSMKRVSIFSNKTTHQVILKMTGSELQISAEDIDFANEAAERMTCSYDGEDMEIAFNSKFMIEMLNNMDAAEIKIMMSQPNRAGIIKPAEQENEQEDILMLVMPLVIK